MFESRVPRNIAREKTRSGLGELVDVRKRETKRRWIANKIVL